MMEKQAIKVAVIGAGGVGAWVAMSLADRGHRVLASTRSAWTARALALSGVDVVEWHWSPGDSWHPWLKAEADVWCVTVPPRMGQNEATSFHKSLNAAAELAGVKRLIWTSSTALYDPSTSGVLKEEDAIHVPSRHTGVDMLSLEAIHRQGKVPFVALRFGGLFGPSRHPVSALLKRQPVKDADGTVQWVHERDAAAACVMAILCEESLPSALNVVAPEVATRATLLKAGLQTDQCPQMQSGGVHRTVSSQKLRDLGFKFRWPSPEIWVKQQAGINVHGMWQGPHGHLHWTKHGPTFGPLKGRALMVHGYKGFREWGNWKGVAERWAQEGWEVIRMDFSHNGHVPPFLERCLDEEAWSSNRHHIERDEVAYALAQIDDGDRPVMVMGHSRGGAMAILGAERHMAAGGRLDGVSLWAPVSDLVSRFPQGEELRAWEASDRLEVVNGRTGQILVHPFGFYTDTIHRADELNLERAARSLTCPVLAIHGTMDTAVHSSEGKRVAEWSAHGTFERVEGADHVFGMAHPWTDAGKWPEHLEEAWRRHRSWMKHLALI
ncbi:MAG: alpha/beta fold hydrolase [Bacteroidota bacterium]|nr:alpha/beta fold hydrolase [Bacteroidota bacterium]